MPLTILGPLVVVGILAIALILHPHPQYGGTMNNKVVYNLHYAFYNMGFTVLRFNFRGVGESEGAYHGEGDTVFNGADDNASGTAGLVALARAIASGPQPERSVVFAAFSGEEKGLLGSRAAVRDGVLPAEKVAFMLNLDMIGRRDSGTFEVVGDGYSTGTREAVEQAGTGIELDVTFAGTDYSGNSDHHPFYEQDVPFAFFFSGLHDDYHKLGDHADKLDYEHMSRVVRLGHAFLSPLADGSWTPRFVHHADWLGATISIVDGDHGTDAVVTEVQPETRAATAGMQVGDRVLAFDDTRLERAEDVGGGVAVRDSGIVTLNHR